MFAILSCIAKQGLKFLVNLHMDMLLEKKEKYESQNPLGSFRNRITIGRVVWHADMNYVFVRLSNQILAWYVSCSLSANIHWNLKIFLALIWFLLADSNLSLLVIYKLLDFQVLFKHDSGLTESHQKYRRKWLIEVFAFFGRNSEQSSLWEIPISLC